MDLDDFWALVERARASAEDPSDIDSVAGHLVGLLVEQDPARIVAAGEELQTLTANAYSWPLWGAAYIINGGASDDGFDYFLGWLIGQGRVVYAAAVADPDSLADVVTEDFGDDGAEVAESEDLLGAPWAAHLRATGEELPAGPAVPRPTLGEQWNVEDEVEMRQRYPRLTAMFF